MSYNYLERRLAKFLDSAPGVRRIAKQAYQRLNYLAAGGSDRHLVLNEAVTIKTCGEWAGIEACGTSAATFFGYYGISPWAADQTRILIHMLEADRGGRPAIIVADQAGARCRLLGTTRAWNFQQGSLAQWLPDGKSVIFNDVIERKLVARMVSVTGGERTVPWPIQAIRADGKEALSINYRRLARIRPEYGYDVDVENFSPYQPLENDGIWRVDLDSGEARLAISIASLTKRNFRPEMEAAEHKVNHVVYSPSGTRFVFMHRWLGRQGKFSRLYYADDDGISLELLLDDRMVSHYAWRDEDTLLVWARTVEDGDRYYLLNVNTGDREVLGRDLLDVFGDGHPSFSPDHEWVVTDTYPDRARRRHLLLFHPTSGRLVHVGSFFAPWRYDGPARCDLHPRWSPDGTLISIDSAHDGFRRSYVVDVSKIVA